MVRPHGALPFPDPTASAAPTEKSQLRDIWGANFSGRQRCGVPRFAAPASRLSGKKPAGQSLETRGACLPLPQHKRRPRVSARQPLNTGSAAVDCKSLGVASREGEVPASVTVSRRSRADESHATGRLVSLSHHSPNHTSPVMLIHWQRPPLGASPRSRRLFSMVPGAGGPGEIRGCLSLDPNPARRAQRPFQKEKIEFGQSALSVS